VLSGKHEVTVITNPIPMTAGPFNGTPSDDVVDRLAHPAPVSASGPLVTLFQCAISFGLLPLLLWPTRWAEFLDTERHDLLGLAAGWRQRVDAPDAARLDIITRRLKPRPILMVLPWLAVGFNVVFLGILFTQGDNLNRLWNLTFRHVLVPTDRNESDSQSWNRDYSPGWERENFHHSLYNRWQTPAHSPLEEHLYTVWIVSLCLAYFCQWYAVRSHAAAVHSLVKWTNKLARENRFTRIRDESKKIGLNFLWIGLGVALCSQQVWWAIPMVLAGAFQRRYSMISSPAVRVALAGQAREAFTISRSGGNRFCAIGHCGARLPAAAKFCPRCGTSAVN
jgi:hypothetical protein